jgi:predicted nucleic-acid-binding protein
MIGVDTNVLVRYVTQDDAEQSARATALIEGLDEDNPGFVGIVVLVELHWVLRRAYRVTADDASTVIRKLLESQELMLQDPDVVRRALRQVTDQVEFPDAVVSELGKRAGCSQTVTFDRRAAQLDGMSLVPG